MKKIPSKAPHTPATKKKLTPQELREANNSAADTIAEPLNHKATLSDMKRKHAVWLGMKLEERKKWVDQLNQHVFSMCKELNPHGIQSTVQAMTVEEIKIRAKTSPAYSEIYKEIVAKSGKKAAGKVLGIEGSYSLAERDKGLLIEKVLDSEGQEVNFVDRFNEVGWMFGLPPALLAGISSKEGISLIVGDGGWGDFGKPRPAAPPPYAFGIIQVDKLKATIPQEVKDELIRVSAQFKLWDPIKKKKDSANVKKFIKAVQEQSVELKLISTVEEIERTRLAMKALSLKSAPPICWAKVEPKETICWRKDLHRHNSSKTDFMPSKLQPGYILRTALPKIPLPNLYDLEWVFWGGVVLKEKLHVITRGTSLYQLATAVSRYNGGSGLGFPKSDIGTQPAGDYANDSIIRAEYYAAHWDEMSGWSLTP